MKAAPFVDRWTLISAGLVSAISLLPQTLKNRLGTAGVFHGWAHLLVFAITAILVCRKDAVFRYQLLRTLGVLGFAAAIEYLQHALYGSSFEWRDVMIDTAGILIGLAVVLIRPIRVSGTPAPR